MSKEQQRMMEDRDKLLNEADNPLTYLFRKILRDWPAGSGDWPSGVEAKNWNMRLTRFLNSHLSRCPKNPKDIGQERNNFNRAISKTQMTFKTFQKALQILGPLKYSMSVTLLLRNGEEITISTPMFKNPYAIIDELSSAVSNKDMSPENDIEDYDQDQDLTADAVGRSIDQIQIPEGSEGQALVTRRRRTYRAD